MLPDVPANGEQLKDYAAMAALLPFVIVGIIRCIEMLLQRRISQEARKTTASVVCFVATALVAWRQGVLVFNWNDTGAMIAAFAIINAIAHNVYDKVVQPVEKLLRKKTRVARRTAERKAAAKMMR